jgi:hypothetical protein
MSHRSRIEEMAEDKKPLRELYPAIEPFDSGTSFGSPCSLTTGHVVFLFLYFFVLVFFSAFKNLTATAQIEYPQKNDGYQ